MVARKKAPKGAPKGFKKFTRELGRFWSPEKDPKDLKKNQVGGVSVCGVVEAFRVVEEQDRGQTRVRHFLDMRTEEHGLVTVDCKGDLWWQLDDTGANLGRGQSLYIEYVGKDAPTTKLPMGIHRFEVWIQE